MKKEVPVIETNRLRLRPISVDDASEIFKNWTADERVAKYMRWTVHQSTEMTATWLKTEVNGNENSKSYQWAFIKKEDGCLFGAGGVNFNDSENCYELGYNLMYPEWNKGYATEAAKAIVDFVIEELGEKQMVAGFMIDNDASGRVMEKCGFVYEKNEVGVKLDGKTKFDSKRYRLKK